MPTPCAEGVPTLFDTSSTCHSAGSFTPSVAVTYMLRSFTKYKLLRSVNAARIPCPLFSAMLMMPLTPSYASGSSVPRRAHQRRILRRVGDENFDVVHQERFAGGRGRAVGINAQREIGRQRRLRREKLRGEFLIGGGGLRDGDGEARAELSGRGAEGVDAQRRRR